MRRQYGTAAGVLAITCAAASVVNAANETAPMMQYLGYTALWQTYGAGLANGSNVPVSIAETLGNNIEGGVTVGSGYYLNRADGRFAGKTLTVTSTFTNPTTVNSVNHSDHATNVGARFFGNDTGFSSRSVVPQVQNIQMYSWSEFNNLYLLNPGGSSTLTPYGSPNNSRVSSHAYGATDTTLGAITRLDYTVQRDDYLHVVDVRNFSTQGNSFNAIVSAPAGNSSTTLTSAVGSGTPYISGRASPTITGPLPGSGSDSIGQVAGVITLLMSKGKTTSSNHSYTTVSTTYVEAPYTGTFSTAVKPGYTVTSGDTSEVVKAALMAGAHRNIATYTNGALTVPGITDYRNTPGNSSSNGLDVRYGAGMVSAINSYEIINAGEQNSFEDGVGGNPGNTPGGIGTRGFDYDPSFGGVGGSNRSATYGFTATASGKFYADLVWNLKIAGGANVGLLDGFGNPTTGSFDTTATLYNLDLKLTDLTAQTETAVSASTVDNTENIWTDLIAGHVYALEVSAVGADFDWDYGLAWRSDVALTATAVPEPAALSLLAVGGLMLARRRR